MANYHLGDLLGLAIFKTPQIEADNTHNFVSGTTYCIIETWFETPGNCSLPQEKHFLPKMIFSFVKSHFSPEDLHHTLYISNSYTAAAPGINPFRYQEHKRHACLTFFLTLILKPQNLQT